MGVSVPKGICDDADELTGEAVRQVAAAAAQCDVLAVGPGMAVGRRQQDLVRAALEQEKPLVLDADALNNLWRIADWAAIRRCPAVLTPHPGEFARLTGRDVKEIQAERESAAVAAVRQWTGRRTENRPPLICALKGAGTVVTDGGRIYVNDTGDLFAPYFVIRIRAALWPFLKTIYYSLSINFRRFGVGSGYNL